jgi:flavin-dependent dehydrogenase
VVTLDARSAITRRGDVVDVAVVGGGPAGLAAAIATASRGLSTVVLERDTVPPDKACGEGLLPPGVQALERLGVTPYLADACMRRFGGVRFVQEDGSALDAALPGKGGLGIRRTVLVEALARRAEAVGVEVRSGCAVREVIRHYDVALVSLPRGDVVARVVVAADGLHSRLRRDAGLDARPGRRRRVALRQHYAIPPWTDRVEVHVDRLGEAVVTPVAADAINVNVVWERGAVRGRTMAEHLDRFPALRQRLAGAATISTVKGAGPMAVRARRRTAHRLVLVGDAAGFIDSISADGLSIAFTSALALGEHLPKAVARGATAARLRGYEHATRRLFRSYWTVTHALLWIARHPACRTVLIRRLARHPKVCQAMVGGAMSLMLATP